MKSNTDAGTTGKKQVKKKKHNSAIAAAAMGRSATSAVRARSTSMSNEGTNIAYEEDTSPDTAL